jgi:tight adherence protein C
MQVTDSIADMLTRIRNASTAKHSSVDIPASNMKVSIAKILRVQADQMRINRRQRAEQEAHQAPVKMTFPLVFLIFPAMLIVILGPALIQITRMLMGGAVN